MKDTKKRFEIKKLFSTPKKAIITVTISIFALAILGTTSIFSVYAIAENVSIGKESAKENAFAAAGVDAEKVDAVKTKFKFHGGKFVYDVEFYSEGKEYEYKIHSKNGKVVGFEKPENISLPENAISVEEAKEIALTHAGVVAEDVTFTKAKLDKDDGIFEYELKFKSESKKYEYDINAENGEIIESKIKNTSIFVSEEDEKIISVEEAKKSVLDHAGITDAYFTKAKLHKEKGIYVYEIKFVYENSEYKYKIDAISKEILQSDNKNEEPVNNAFPNSNGNHNGIENGSNPQKPALKPECPTCHEFPKCPECTECPAQNPNNDKGPHFESFIGIEKAKELVLEKSGLAAENVTFTKAKLEKERGLTVYEIEFICDGKEYEFSVNALSGEIIEFEVE